MHRKEHSVYRIWDYLWFQASPTGRETYLLQIKGSTVLLYILFLLSRGPHPLCLEQLQLSCSKTWVFSFMEPCLSSPGRARCVNLVGSPRKARPMSASSPFIPGSQHNARRVEGVKKKNPS